MMTISRTFGTTTLALLLAACASTRTADVETRGTRPAASVPAPAPSRNAERSTETPPAPVPFPPATPKKGGGYYKDDGPGDNPPPDMASIPDAQPRAEPLHRFANRPYAALGQNYVPLQELTSRKETGIASWYGRRFHGVSTSSGERYDMYGMTAAHPTLPIPSYARVTNLENGKSVVVRINDRGPFHSDRVIDLSYTAAWKLGYVSKGSARVEVESIVPEGVTVLAKNVPPIVAPAPLTTSPPDADVGRAMPELQATASHEVLPPPVDTALPPAADPPPGAYLQLGAFNSNRNAEGFRDYAKQELSALKQQLFIIKDGEGEGERFRLLSGPFNSPGAARVMAGRIESRLKLKPFLVQR
ncbi:MAG: rlpA [Rhodocyclales bacterium]|nr:rlpA [Rhodocyclales bacterium]